MKIGLFGGTFDPLHIGHLVVAKLAKESMNLDQVIFIPSGIPPHKLGKQITPGEQRLQMVELAISDNTEFAVSDWELYQQRATYTVDTLEFFASQYAKDELYFIVGADMLCDLPNWKSPQRILELAEIIGMTRPGFNLTECRTLLQTLLPAANSRIHYIEMPGLDISSTWLRDRLRQHLSVDYLIPEQVIRYIEETGLYD